MWNLLKYDMKRSIDIKRIVLAAIVSWTALAFFSLFFAKDMTEDRLLEKLTIGIIDQEESQLSQMLIQSFQGNQKFSSLISIQVDEADVLWAQYNSDALTALVTIPENFTNSLLHYENDPLEVVLNPNHPLKATILSEMLSSYSDYIKAVDAATLGLYQALDDSNVSRETLKTNNDLFSVQMISTALGRNELFSYDLVSTFPSTSSGEYFGAAVLVIVAAFGATSIIPLVYDDIREHCLHRYLMNHNHLHKWLLSKLLALSVNISMLCVLIAVPVIFLYGLSILQSLWLVAQIFIMTLLFGAVILTVGLFIGELESANVASHLIIFALGLLGGNFIPLPLMPKSIQDLSAFTPNYWIIKSLIYTFADFQKGWPFLEISLVIIAVLLVAFSASRLKSMIRKGGYNHA